MRSCFLQLGIPTEVERSIRRRKRTALRIAFSGPLDTAPFTEIWKLTTGRDREEQAVLNKHDRGTAQSIFKLVCGPDFG